LIKPQKEITMKKSVLITALLSTLSMGAMAETPSFNYFEIGQTEVDFDNVPVDLDGLEFDFNMELSDSYYLSADYAKVDRSGIDLKMKNIGIGFKSDISDSSTFFTQIDWANISSNAGVDEDGYRLGLGVRSNWTKDLEVSAAYEYLDIDNDSSSFYILGAAYKLTDSFAGYADYKTESDLDQISFGVRFEF